MITAKSEKAKFRTLLDNGETTVPADIPAGMGGGGGAFMPFDFLASAYAACLVITTRMILERKGLAYDDVRAAVDLDREQPGRTVFRSRIEIDGDIPVAEKDAVVKLASNCPIRKTLDGQIDFESL